MKIVMWDWKEQPDWNEINAALRSYEMTPAIFPVQTKQDCYAVLIAGQSTTQKEAQQAYDLHKYERDAI